MPFRAGKLPDKMKRNGEQKKNWGVRKEVKRNVTGRVEKMKSLVWQS